MINNSPNQNEKLNDTRAEQTLRASELSYPWLFEMAKEGILILDACTGRITDTNPFLCKLLGVSKAEMLGNTIGELNPFKTMASIQAMLEQLQRDGYTSYEDLPLETKDDRKIAVEFVGAYVSSRRQESDPMQHPRHHGAEKRQACHPQRKVARFEAASVAAKRRAGKRGKPSRHYGYHGNYSLGQPSLHNCDGLLIRGGHRKESAVAQVRQT